MPYKDPEQARANKQRYYLAKKAYFQEKHLEYREIHKEEIKKINKEYYESNKERINQKNRFYYHEHRDMLLPQQREYYATHREEQRAKQNQYNAENREKLLINHRQRNKKYKSSHLPKVAFDQKVRRARKKHAPVNDLTHTQWLEIQERQNHCCCYCGKRCKGKLTQDHITPLSKGGSHTLHNVIGACGSCNSRKGTKPPLIPIQPFLLTIAVAAKNRAI